MNCADCEEPILESERLAARLCRGCKHEVHSECAMLGPGSHDYCETCFYKARADFVLTMAAASMDDSKRRELKKRGIKLIDEDVPDSADSAPPPLSIAVEEDDPAMWEAQLAAEKGWEGE